MASSVNEKQGLTAGGFCDQRVTNFLLFFNTIDHILAVVDYKGSFVEVNRAGLDFLGYSLDELQGRDVAMIFPKETHKEIARRFKDVKIKGVGDWQYTLLAKSGMGIRCEISFHKGIWNNENALYVVAKFLSPEELISEARKVSVKVLYENNNKDAESIASLALEETIRLTNSGLGFYGRYNTRDEILEGIQWQLNNSNFPADLLPETMELKANKGWEDAINKRAPIILDKKQIAGMGKGIEALKNAMIVPLKDDDSMNYFVGLGNKAGDYNLFDANVVSILWDNVITEIRRINTQKELAESEFEYKNLFDSSRDALLLYDLEKSKIILTNKAAVNMFGYASQDELKKKSPLEMSAEYQPDGTSSIDALVRNPINALHECINIPYWTHIKKNGEAFPSEVCLTAINYKGKKIVLANVRDISYKIKVESELKKSEESFNIAVEEGGLGIWDYDVASKHMDVGSGFYNILDIPKGDKIENADQWLKLIYQEDIELVNRALMDHIEGRSEKYFNEYRIRKSDGTYMWVHASGRAVERDENGIAKRLVGVLYDINSIKELTRQVEDTRNFLETIISSIEAILFVKDTEGRYLLVNRSFIDKFGLQGTKIIGEASAKLNIPIDTESVLTDEIVIKQGIEQTYEQEIKLSDGKMYDYLISKIPIKDKNGEVYAQVGLATDITHIKGLEKDLRNNVFSLDAAVNGTGNGLWEWNPGSDNLILNDNWFSMLGYTRSQFNKKYNSFDFQTFADYVHPEDLNKIGEELEKHYVGKTQYYRIEIRMLTSENQWKWILASGKVWEWDDENKPSRMVGIHVDIDYRVRIEEQLKHALVKAEESDRLKSAFLANMSHEIRTPMNGIIGFLDLIGEDELNLEQRQEYMSIIRNSSNQLLDIVNDIVDISKIEAGQVIIRETSFNISKLVEDIEMQYRPALDGKKLYLKTNIQLRESEMNIVSDHTKLRQILSNLVSNSIKFTDKGVIEINCKRDNAQLLFSIKDTGAGIPIELHARVFERFVQAEMGLSRLQEGTGLGLSICRAYIEKLGGKIWLESKVGEGSSFYFTLPIDFDQEDEDLIVEEKPEINDNQEGLILIVEDEIYNYLFVEQILQNRGLRVLHAENGNVALELVKTNPSIAMIFMDIRLPGMDGYELTRLIKKDYPSLPIIALTALALSGDREKALEAGCDDYLKKPVLREELLSVVDKVFNT